MSTEQYIGFAVAALGGAWYFRDSLRPIIRSMLAGDSPAPVQPEPVPPPPPVIDEVDESVDRVAAIRNLELAKRHVKALENKIAEQRINEACKAVFEPCGESDGTDAK